jgi:O-acetyl-ADP-ribose deacetylase (regulator of RNase III)
MVTIEPVEGVRFGRTTIVAVAGDLLDQGVEAVVLAANRRGVLGALPAPSFIGLRSLGGSPIEREAMARAPLELGTVIVTPAFGLEARGVHAVIHAVVHRSLGEPAQLGDVRRAVVAAVGAAERHRLRSLAVPLFGVDAAAGRGDPARFIGAIVEELVGCLRRATARLDRVVIVCRFDDHSALAATALARAREQSWVPVR